jgi:hypothetical protein
MDIICRYCFWQVEPHFSLQNPTHVLTCSKESSEACSPLVLKLATMIACVLFPTKPDSLFRARQTDVSRHWLFCELKHKNAAQPGLAYNNTLPSTGVLYGGEDAPSVVGRGRGRGHDSQIAFGRLHLVERVDTGARHRFLFFRSIPIWGLRVFNLLNKLMRGGRFTT